MASYVGNDAQNTFTLATSGISDVSWSNDEKLIYAATNDGKIEVFDVATHALLNTWSIGKSLGALSLSDDGKTLVAGGVTAAGSTAVFAINTATGVKTVFQPAVAGVSDVEIVDNQRVLVSGNGAGRILTLDLATGKFAALAGGVSYSPFSTFTEDRHLTLFGEGGISDGPLFIYDDRTGTVVAAGDNYQSGAASGFNFAIQGISEAAGLVFQFGYYQTVNIYDLNLKVTKSTALGDGPAEGYAFSADGKAVYVYFIAGQVNEYRLSDFAKIASFTAPAASWGSGGYGNALHVGKDGNYLSVLANSDSYASVSSLTLIDVSSRNETFKGTAGADTFAGGLGNDTYFVNNTGDLVTERALGGNDTVITAGTYALTANVETLKLVGSAAIDGTGNAQDNTLSGNTGLNTLDGGSGNDRLIGIGGGDTLKGGLGDDTLVSGKGIDTLIGGAGDDTYVVNDSGDMIQEDAAGGIDTVQVAASYVLADNLENLVLGAKAASGTGNAADNTMTGNLLVNTLDGGDGNDTLRGMAGKDVLIGGAGDDILDGGTGADAMTGGAGSDTYFVDHARDTIIEDTAGSGTDTVIASLDWTLAEGIENLKLAQGSSALNGTGNALANVITGNAANNLLDGGLGADRMNGGTGDDTYVVDNAGDRVTESAEAGTDTVLSSLTLALGANIENLTLQGRGAINGTGNLLANVITGNAANNVLDGGGVDLGFGTDTLIGGAGNDTYIVTPFYRFTIVENAGEGIDRCISAVSFDALPENVENLLLTGTASISGGGNALGNLITGNIGDNTLYGKDGNDKLVGGDGNDALIGGAGDDILLGGAGADALYGNGGTNTLKGGTGNDVYYVGEGIDRIAEKAGEGDRDVIISTVSITAPLNVEMIGLSGSGAINAAGNAQANAIYGNEGVNLLNGLGGDDVLGDYGFNDTLTGGTGADVFAFGSLVNGGTSTITDFNQAEHDAIRLSAIDANIFTAGTEAFNFIGIAAFTGAFGQLRYEQIGGNTLVTGDVNGDKAADFTIELKGLITLTQSDFQLML